ncbi:MAG TPA: hypothetical protein VHP14_14575, partial [Anaerolineales bacterium]|nr:hypothetical protein [Anaerolineales bacterium]
MQIFNRSMWGRALAVALVMVLLTSNAALAATVRSTPRQPNTGEVLINEFVAVNGTVQTSEWVELYNATAEPLDI